MKDRLDRVRLQQASCPQTKMQLTVATGIAMVLASIAARKLKVVGPSQPTDCVEERELDMGPDPGMFFESQGSSGEENTATHGEQIKAYQNEGWGSVSIAGFSYKGSLTKDPVTGEPHWMEKKKIMPPTTFSYGVPREPFRKLVRRKSKDPYALHE